MKTRQLIFSIIRSPHIMGAIFWCHSFSVSVNLAAAYEIKTQAHGYYLAALTQDQEYERAISLLKADRPKEALEIMRGLYKQGYSSPGFFYYSGRTMFRLKYYGAAMIMFMKAAQLKPESLDSLYWFALSAYNDTQFVLNNQSIDAERRKKLLSDVVRAYSLVLNKDPSYAMARYDRAYTYGLMGDHDAAIQDYLVAIKGGYKLEWSHAMIGESYWLTGNVVHAVLHFNKSLRYNRSNQVALEYLSIVNAWANTPAPAYANGPSPSYFGKPNMMGGYEKHPSDPNSDSAHWNWERCGKWSGC